MNSHSDDNSDKPWQGVKSGRTRLIIIASLFVTIVILALVAIVLGKL